MYIKYINCHQRTIMANFSFPNFPGETKIFVSVNFICKYTQFSKFSQQTYRPKFNIITKSYASGKHDSIDIQNVHLIFLR